MRESRWILVAEFQSLRMFKWQLYSANDLKKKWSFGNMLRVLMKAGAPAKSDEDQHSLRETLLNTNIYLLGRPIVVSIL